MRDVAQQAGPSQTRVWDVPTRVVHWLLVVLIPFSWWSATYDHLQWHRLSGYGVLGLLVFRLFWGVVGSDTARFATFLKGPGSISAYLKGAGRAYMGHNPLGGWSVIALLLMLGVQVGLGLFAVDEDGLDPSPLAKFVSFKVGRAVAELHHITFYVLLGLIALHLAALAVYAARGHNLTAAMITGRRPAPSGAPAARFAPIWVALPVAVIALAAAWFVSRGLKF
jgi:cytochrome b